MAKIAKQYLEVDPYKIIEKGFHKDRLEVSESLFSLCNEYMGSRGYFDEGISGNYNSLRGNYFNGIYDYSKETLNTGYKGIVTRTHFMVNSVDYFKIELIVDGEKLDLNQNDFTDFYRELSFLSGLSTRKFIWHTKSNANIEIKIEKFLSLVDCHNAFQKVTITSDKKAKIKFSMFLNNDSIQWRDCSYFNVLKLDENRLITLNETLTTKEKVVVKESIISNKFDYISKINGKDICSTYELEIGRNETIEFTRICTCLTSKEFGTDNERLIKESEKENKKVVALGFEKYLELNEKYFKNVYEISDISIEGSDIDQQGIRFCIYMLNTTYHGYSEFNNIGAKGLTGEAYSGHAFWDSETYCLPYYLFNNLDAAKNLILFRYNTLVEAKERAKDLDCRGACFPIATLNGKEACTLWQHASLQVQPSSGVVYAIFHYYNLTKDISFIYKYGYEMTLEVAKFLLDRGQYNSNKTKFGYYAVMGPDEFKMMVNNNAYTNIMGKFVFEFTKYIKDILVKNGFDVSKVEEKVEANDKFFEEINEASQKMELKFNKESLLFEQNDGFFDLPHIDVDKIPNSDFPLYSHWTYDRIYRGDMIKQPDVLMFIFLFMSHFGEAVKKANYEYYEPRCIHESSLSPSVHSIIAQDIGKEDEAINFFGYASRLDLDDYNNNTCEGLHMTSIAAAWVNIVYGFGGLRSDAENLSLRPKIPERWKSYSFRIRFEDSVIKVYVDHSKIVLENSGSDKNIILNGSLIKLGKHYEVEIN